MNMLLDYFLAMCKKQQIISDDEISFYKYGLNQLIMYALFIIIQITVYGIFGYILNGMMFLAFFLTLRRYSGGYHANSKLTCILISNFIPLFLLLLYYMEVKIDNTLLIAATVAASVAILVLSPVDNANKPLNDKEKKKYKLYTVIILTIELIVLFVGIFIFDYKFNLLIAYAIFMNAALVLAGYIKKTAGRKC